MGRLSHILWKIKHVWHHQPDMYVYIYIFIYICVCARVILYVVYIQEILYCQYTHMHYMCFSLSLSIFLFLNPSPRLQEFSLRIPPQPPGLVDLFCPTNWWYLVPIETWVFNKRQHLNTSWILPDFQRGFPCHGWPKGHLGITYLPCPAVKVQGCCLCTLQFGLVIRDTLRPKAPWKTSSSNGKKRPHKVGPIVS